MLGNSKNVMPLLQCLFHYRICHHMSQCDSVVRVGAILSIRIMALQNSTGATWDRNQWSRVAVISGGETV